jgi:DNA polymerase-3 subunit alpha
MDKQQVVLAGLVTNVDRRVSKSGNPWAIVTLEDLEMSIQAMFFGKSYLENADDLKIDTIVKLRGNVEVRDEEVQISGREVEEISVEDQDLRPVIVTLPNKALERSRVEAFESTLRNFPGVCTVELRIIDSDGNVTELDLGDKFRVNRDTSLFAAVKALFGPASMQAA